MSPDVVLLPECGPGVGLGHLERMLALADSLETRRLSVLIVAAADDVVVARIQARGHASLSLAGDIAERALHVADHVSPRTVVVDAYTLPVVQQTALRRIAPTVVVDDLAHECDCDLGVNPSPGGETMAPVGARRFLGGAAFALISAAYLDARARHNQHSTGHGNALVATGATAFGDLGAELSRGLVDAQPTLRVTLVIGPDVRSGEIAPRRSRIDLVISPPSLSDLLAAHDIYVGAAGTTALQAACVGVPAVIIPMATNQVRQAQQLEAAGCALARDAGGAVAAALHVLADPSALTRMARAGTNLVDGLGAERVADAVCALIAESARL